MLPYIEPSQLSSSSILCTHMYTPGVVGGGLGIWGIVTAANNMKVAEMNSPDRSFVWKPTGRYVGRNVGK